MASKKPQVKVKRAERKPANGKGLSGSNVRMSADQARESAYATVKKHSKIVHALAKL